MKRIHFMFFVLAAAVIFSACSNIPQAPTKTPTMSAEQVMMAAQETAEAMKRETETQWAIDNPSPTPTDTATPTPEATPTSAIPVIPPTATEQPKAYLHIDNKSAHVWEVGNPSNWNDFVPFTDLYIEVCWQNNGSGTWTENYYAMVTNTGGANVQPRDPVYLGKTVNPDETACFSFNRIGGSNTALKTYCPVFQLYTDAGAAIRNGNNSVCFTIH